jgi:hypothetical protein
LDLWEGGLRASGGAIVPSKTAWNLTSFKWNNGIWKYQTVDETPATLAVKDIDRHLYLMQI